MDATRHRRTAQARGCADPLEIVESCTVAAEQQMIAVVDAAAELAVEIGTAAAAGLRARLVNGHIATGAGEADRRRQSCQPRSDDVDAAGHQNRTIRKARAAAPARA